MVLFCVRKFYSLFLIFAKAFVQFCETLI
ncbi:rCG24603 [Rattus norvegicus]|uniref:RCG24603 n=1 Tax=Rattus norvegicus TaxID=10116 RepID=A6JBJ3_RAT|nr:rCG24603 [Rattus norvegicus]